MFVELRCDCGKRFQVVAGRAGQEAECPRCGAAVPVPRPRGERAPEGEGPLAWPCTSFPDNLVVLTDDAVVFASVPEPAQVVADLRGGARPGSVLPGTQTAVRFDDLAFVRIDRHDTWMTIGFWVGGKERSRFLVLPDKAACDELYAGICARAGSDWQETEWAMSRWLAGLGPVAATLLVLMFCGLFYWTASILASPDEARTNLWRWFVGWTLDTFGSVVAWGVSLALLAFCAWWITSMLWRPPVLVTAKVPGTQDW